MGCSCKSASGARRLLAGRLDSAQPIAGVGLALNAITPVVIGGASLIGGKGSMLGTLLGMLIIGLINNGQTLQNVRPFWVQFIQGAVLMDSLSQKRRAGVVKLAGRCRGMSQRSGALRREPGGLVAKAIGPALGHRLRACGGSRRKASVFRAPTVADPPSGVACADGVVPGSVILGQVDALPLQGVLHCPQGRLADVVPALLDLGNGGRGQAGFGRELLLIQAGEHARGRDDPAPRDEGVQLHRCAP